MKTVFLVAMYDFGDEPEHIGVYDTIEQARIEALAAFRNYYPNRWRRILAAHGEDIDEAEANLLERAENLTCIWGLAIQELELNALYDIEY